MTTVWEPDLDELRASVAEMEGRASEEEEDASNKGTKRKRAPHTKGPCEHGVKQRSKCKVCSACPHGKRRSRCKECGGGSICEHGRQRSQCKECGGSQICEHDRQRPQCNAGAAGLFGFELGDAIQHRAPRTWIDQLLQVVHRRARRAPHGSDEACVEAFAVMTGTRAIKVNPAGAAVRAGASRVGRP